MRIAASKFSNMFTKFVWAALLMSALLLSACGGKDKSVKTPKGQVALSASVLKFETLPARTVSEEEAEQALLAFGLGEDAKDVKRTGKGGNYIYTNIALESDEFSIESLEVKGLHMLDDVPMFDSIAFKDVTSIDEDSGVRFSFKEAIFVGPTPMLSQIIADSIKNRSVISEDEDVEAYFKAVTADIDQLNLSAEDREARLAIGFDSFSISGISAEAEGLDMTIESIIFGQAADGTGAAQIENISVNFADVSSEEKGALKLGLYETTGFNLKKYAVFANPDFYIRAETEGFEEELSNLLISFLDPYNPDYESYLIKDFSFAIEGNLSVDMDQASLVSTRKSGVITRVTTVSPITILWPEQVADTDMQEIIDAYASMGYDKLVISGGMTAVLNEARDTIDVSEYYVQFDNMFKVSADIKMGGVKKAMTIFASMFEELEGKSDDEAGLEMMKILASEFKTFEFAVTFTDLSIIERSLKLGAEKLTEEGVGDFTPEMMNGKAKAGVMMLPMAAQDDAQLEYLTDVSEALTSLLDNSGSITFSMKPKMPLDIEAIAADAQNGEFDISVLGLGVSAQEPKH